jgi:hypothetical protein
MVSSHMPSAARARALREQGCEVHVADVHIQTDMESHWRPAKASVTKVLPDYHGQRVRGPRTAGVASCPNDRQVQVEWTDGSVGTFDRDRFEQMLTSGALVPVVEES